MVLHRVLFWNIRTSPSHRRDHVPVTLLLSVHFYPSPIKIDGLRKKGRSCVPGTEEFAYAHMFTGNVTIPLRQCLGKAGALMGEWNASTVCDENGWCAKFEQNLKLQQLPWHYRTNC